MRILNMGVLFKSTSKEWSPIVVKRDSEVLAVVMPRKFSIDNNE